jgi:hypothetical protein
MSTIATKTHNNQTVNKDDDMTMVTQEQEQSINPSVKNATNDDDDHNNTTIKTTTTKSSTS